MSALEIKPGKYRTRGGCIVTVTNPADQYWIDHGYAWRVIDVSGQDTFVTVDGRYRSNQLYGVDANDESPFDLIERIEDEPKAEESARRYITDGAWQNIVKKRGYGEEARDFSEKAQRAEGNVVVAAEEFDLIVAAARVIDTANTYAKEACGIVGNAQAALDEATKRIARLEAENESLSRQLRSRKLNSEPVTTGKKWRWSPSL